MSEESATIRLDRLASAIYGEVWALPLADLAGVAPRNCQRAMAAARAGTDYAGSEGIIRAVDERLEALMIEAAPPTGEQPD